MTVGLKHSLGHSVVVLNEFSGFGEEMLSGTRKGGAFLGVLEFGPAAFFNSRFEREPEFVLQIALDDSMAELGDEGRVLGHVGSWGRHEFLRLELPG